MGLGVLLALVLLWKLYQSTSKLPEEWKKNTPQRNFRRGIFFLCMLLSISLVTEIVSQYLAHLTIFNSFVFSIDFTVTTLFLFGFLFINTQNRWKRYAYFIFYTIIVGYLINGGYYDPNCVLPGNSSVLIFSLYFIAALLHLTDLLPNPKSTHFNFQLKINLSILIYSLISVIVTSFYWAQTMKMGNIHSEFMFYLHALNIYLFYISFIAIFISEILKLRRG